MSRRPLLALVTAAVVALAAATGAAAGDIVSQKQQVDEKLEQLKSHIATIQQREEGLRSEIAQVNGQISALESKVGTVSSQLTGLKRDLGLRKQRLAALRELYKLETQRLIALGRQFRTAERHLDRRIVDLYQQGRPTTVDVVLEATSIQDFLDTMDFVTKISAEDRRIVVAVATARKDMSAARLRTKKVAAGVQAEARVIAARASQVSLVRSQLLTQQGQLADTRSAKAQSLDTLNAQERQDAEEMDALAAASARLGDQIRVAQEAARRAAEQKGQAQTAAPGRLQWPASGPVTSPFGPRWGRMHTGIDIGAAMGSPVVAAAAGTVIVAGWADGYGNTVVVDHGGGMATLSGHQSQIDVTVGQSVTAGQQLGLVGSTGRSTGPHLHFEVRSNGTPVDPLGYL